MSYNETVKRTRAAKEGAGMDCHTFCRLSCISVSALILGLYLHLHAFVVVLSLPQFCRYIVVYVVLFCSVFCIYCVRYSNSRLVEYIVFDAIPLLFQTDVCILVFLPHDGSCYRSVVSFLFIPMFVRLCLCVSYFCYCVNVVFIFFFCCEDTFENPQT